MIIIQTSIAGSFLIAAGVIGLVESHPFDAFVKIHYTLIWFGLAIGGIIFQIQMNKKPELKDTNFDASNNTVALTIDTNTSMDTSQKSLKFQKY